MRKAILLSVLFAIPLMVNAFNGKAKVGGIWYNIVTKAERAEVTKPDVGNYSGIIKIPSTIVYEGVTCKVTAIGSGAFAWGEMTSVTIPNTVTKIDALAFRWCEKLQNVTIPESVVTIGNSAFDGCYALKAIKLPQQIEAIEEGLFQNCYRLQSIIVPDKVKKIGNYAFDGCRGLKSVKMGDKIVEVGDYAFKECEELQEIVLPNCVVTIGRSAFYDCKRLSTVTLGRGVESIGSQAFSNCGDLKDFYMNGGRLPKIFNNSNIFDGSEVEYTTLHVAESLVELCKQVEPWKSFGKVVVNPNATKEEVGATADETIYEPSDCNGQTPTPFMKRYELGEWDGTISNAKMIRSMYPAIDKEAIRVIESMPKWNPGRNNGQPVRVKYMLPVSFK